MSTQSIRSLTRTRSIRQSLSRSELLLVRVKRHYCFSTFNSLKLGFWLSRCRIPRISSPLISAPRSSSTMASQQFLDDIASRRSYYQLNAKSPISDARIKEIIEHALLHVPSAFNSQTVRIILLLKEEHKKLWDIIQDVLRGVVPEDQFSVVEQKLNGFKAAYGTVSRGSRHSMDVSHDDRYCSLMTDPRSTTIRQGSPFMLISFPPGPTKQMACINLPFGPPWKRKDSEQTYSIITL